jgi:hypothetical protein
LSSYVRHATAARRIAALIEAEEQSDDFSLADYARLLALQERESRSLAMLAVKLRVCKSAFDVRWKQATAPATGKPWQD